jgi:ectoine hydroxylase-related dioxygenase (phytanoyl-CoA dioxygenase family)
MTSAARLFHDQGFVVVRRVVSEQLLREAEERLNALNVSRAGTRNLLGHEWCRSLAASIRNHASLADCLPPTLVAVQCTYFDKSPLRNWRVAFHQDLAVPTSHRSHHPELGAWSEKEGQLFVHAPAAVLAQLLAVRVHIDPATTSNGPLRVIPGSHRLGRLNQAQIQEARSTSDEVVCTAQRGDVLLMQPLILHASSKGTIPDRRRVLHFLFAPPNPGYGIQW